MVITTTKEIKQDVKIQVPSFWKNDNGCLYAVLSDKQVIEVYDAPDLLILKDCDPLYCSDLQKGFKDCDEITEEEFFAAWEKAYKQLNLMPVLKS